MLPLLSSPFYAFFLSSTLSLWSRFLSDARVLLKYLMRPHMSRHHNHCEAAEIRDRPCPHPRLNTRSSRSHGLNPLRWRLPLALKPEVSNELLSVRAGAPVTRSFVVFQKGIVSAYLFLGELELTMMCQHFSGQKIS